MVKCLRFRHFRAPRGRAERRVDAWKAGLASDAELFLERVELFAELTHFGFESPDAG